MAELQRDVAEQELAQRSVLAILRGHNGPVSTAAFSSDGRLVVTASRDGTGRVWDAATGQSLLLLPGDGRLTSAAFDPAVERIVTTSEDGTVRLWNWRRLSSSLENRIALVKVQRDLGVDADGELGPVTMGALKREVSTRFAPSGPPVWDAAFSPDGTLLATADRSGRVRVYKVSDGEPQATLRHTTSVTSVAFDPTSRLVVTAGRDGRVTIWRWRTQVRPGTLLHRGVRTASFSPDGLLVLTAGDDGTARVWTRDGERLRFIRGGTPILDAAFSDDGRLVITALATGSAEIWRLRLREGAPAVRSAELGGHVAAVTSASFSAAEPKVATSSEDRTARIWRLPDL